MLKKLIFIRCCNFFLNEFLLPGMSWLSQTPEKPQPSNVFFTVESTGYRLAAEVNRQHSECVCMSLYTHKLRVLPIHFARETVPSG